MDADRPLHAHVVVDGLGYGGAETLLGDLAAAAPGAGLRLTVTALGRRRPDPAARRLRALGIDVEVLDIGGLLAPRDHRRLWRRLRAVAPDVLHAHLEYADLFAGVAARRLGLPCVSTIHVMRWEEDRRERLKLALAARARAIGMQAVICVSAAAREAYLAQGWPTPPVLVVPNGIAADVRPEASAALRERLGIARGARVVGTLSVLRDGKGHEALFAALPALRAAVPDVEVLVAGDGPDAARITAAARAAGARPVGHVEDPLAFVGALDVLAHPSAVDALPTALMEAAAAGTPVVATAVGGIPDIVDDGRTGLLLGADAGPEGLAAALAALLGDPGRRAAMAAAARERHRERFSADRWAARLREVYGQAVSERRS